MLLSATGLTMAYGTRAMSGPAEESVLELGTSKGCNVHLDSLGSSLSCYCGRMGLNPAVYFHVCAWTST